MPDFNIENLKQNWQEQQVTAKYQNADILKMLNKKSRNYVKYILWISIAEFLVFLFLSIYYLFCGNDGESFIRIMERIGAENTESVKHNFNVLYSILKGFSLLVTGYFVMKFYENYKKINIESNLKKFILQIIRFKRTVNLFILCNILMVVAFTVVLSVFIFVTLNSQNIELDNASFTGFLVGLLVSLLFCLTLIWLYYRLAYGIIISRLTKNLKQLQEIEKEQ